MKFFKRGIALFLTLCTLLAVMPPVQFVHAAEVTQRYELDTDGIDVGATYLIVNAGTAGSGNGLMFYYYSSSSRDLHNQALTIMQEDGGILPVAPKEAIELMTEFTGHMLEKQNTEPLPEEPEEKRPSVEEQMQENKKKVEALFVDIRQWLKTV